ncbi:MAG: AraC family transcriptional regulator, partial [Lachnospiraceae bacterium]|nr:AraC family transcriptional regulator [Lachnospiraceae bacterium]
AERLHDCMYSTAFGHAALAKALIIELMLKAKGYSSAERPQNKSSLIPPLVSKILDHIESNINDDLTIKKMARDLHYSSDHLSRVFSKATGDSLKHYINAKKMVLAQKLLHQKYSPSDVCFMLGYNNYSSFSRRFSKQIGTSPNQFRRGCGQNPEHFDT